MRIGHFGVLAASAAMLLGMACRTNTVDKAAFKTALNDYYSSRHTCVWEHADEVSRTSRHVER